MKKTDSWVKTRRVGSQRALDRKAAVEARRARKEKREAEKEMHRAAKAEHSRNMKAARERRWRAIQYNIMKHGRKKAMYIADIVRRIHTGTMGYDNRQDKIRKAEAVAARKAART